MALYGQGADIVFNVAGPTGEGVLQASAAANKYSIGVDIDQCDVAPGHVMASMMKHADVAVYSLIKDVVDGKGVEPGSIHTYDLKSGGVELLLCPQVVDKIPADVKSKLDALKADIVSGKITVATTTK